MNRLSQSTSPYLLQHQHNPVDWYPWGDEALARAKAEDKPIFLSIGYAACHWCHVMERESFENAEIAAFLNQHFVCVKVDREQRPDLDEIYMAATLSFTGGHGGWPMTVFLTPEQKPFFAGTYFPPDDRSGQPGFPRVLRHVHSLWRDRRDDVLRAAGNVADDLAARLAPKVDADEPKPGYVDAAAAAGRERYDDEHGGFGPPPRFAPKFPHASELAMLLRHHARTGDPDSLRTVTDTLRHMVGGGIYDQLRGGFHRYSTDREWLVPHFEKMLYDNAQLVPLLLETHLHTGESRWAEVAGECLDYLLDEMRDPKGGMWSTQDADSEGVEGRFFVWTRDEFDQVLGDDAELLARHLDVTAAGNWEGHNVLRRVAEVDELAAAFDLSAAEVGHRLQRGRARLLAARSRRVRPGTDDKVLAAWNGLALTAFARGHQVLDDARYLDAARGIADFVLTEMVRDRRLLRTWRRGEAQLAGYLEDYAFVADGLLWLFESDFDPRWLAAAGDLLAVVRERFLDPADGSFFFTADDHEPLIARAKSPNESSVPSGIAVATSAFLRLGLLTGDVDTWEIGARALRANHGWLARAPLACPSLVLAMQLYLGDPVEVVIAGDPGAAATGELLRAARRAFPPHRVVALVHDGNRTALAAIAAIVDGKEPVDRRPAGFVCRRGACEQPVTDAAALLARLRRSP